MKIRWWGLLLIGVGSWWIHYHFLKNKSADQVQEVSAEFQAATESAKKLVPAANVFPGTAANESELEKGPQKAFQIHAEKVFSQLPTMAQIRAQVQNAQHTAPPALILAAQQIGELTDEVYKDQALKPEGLNFFVKCATTADLVPSIRAVCYERASKLHLEIKGQSLSLDLPPEVNQLIKRQ